MPNTLAVSTPSDREIVLTRDFDAPRDLVFDALTQPEHLSQWWGPAGFKVHTAKVDLRPGGSFLYGMTAPDRTADGFPVENGPISG